MMAPTISGSAGRPVGIEAAIEVDALAGIEIGAGSDQAVATGDEVKAGASIAVGFIAAIDLAIRSPFNAIAAIAGDVQVVSVVQSADRVDTLL